MALVKQIMPLPLAGGLNQAEDALVSNRPQQMVNCRYSKTPAVSKRAGYTCIGLFNNDSQNQTPPAPECLAPYQNELIRIGGGKLATYAVLNGASDWITRGRVPECLVKKESAVAGTAIAASTYTNPSVAYASGYLVTAYAVNDGVTYRILCDVTDTTTGARIFSQQQMFSAGLELAKPTCVASGTKVGIFWSNNSTFQIQGRFLDLSTMQFAAAAVVASSIAAAGLSAWDCDAVSATEWVFAYELNTGVNHLGYQAVSPTISGGAFTPVSSLGLLATTDVGLDVLSLRVVPGVRSWIAYSFTSGGTTYVKAATFTPAYANETAPFVLDSYAANDSITVGIEVTSNTDAIVLWNCTDDASKWAEAAYTGTVTWGPRTLLQNFFLTRPLVRNGRGYALCANVHSVRSSQFIVDLSRGEDLPDNGSPRIAAVVLPIQLPPGVRPRYKSAGNWADVGGDEYIAVSLVQGVKATSLAIVGLRVSFATTWRRNVVQTSNLLIIGGGALSIYDGAAVSELGFAYDPDAALVILVPNTGGALTPSTKYGYAFVYVWTDGQGGVHRSGPSVDVSVDLGPTDTKVHVNVPCLQLTNKDAGTSTPNIGVEVYRTKSNGSVYFHVTTLPNVCGTAKVAFDDVAGDDDISSGLGLYTDGGLKAHAIPGGGSLVLPWKGCVLVAGTDDDSIWLSGEILAFEGPWFSPTLNIDAFEGGRITALSQLDATPILFKETSAFYLMGEPPNDLGVSDIGAPRRIQTEAGCVDPASVVVSKFGVARMAQTGIFLLDRSLADQEIGRAVEDSYRSSGAYAGAEVLPAQGTVRWLQRGEGGVDALNWDYTHSQDFGAPTWSVDELADVRTAPTAPANAAAACLWRGDFVWISTAGYLYREDTATFADADGIGGQTWISMRFETANAKPFGIAGWERVWRALFTGLRKSPHDMTVTLTTESGAQSWSWTDAEVLAFGGLPDERFMLHVQDQKCSWMRVKWEDAEPAAAELGTREGMVLRDISLEVGQKPAGARFRAAQRK